MVGLRDRTHQSFVSLRGCISLVRAPCPAGASPPSSFRNNRTKHRSLIPSPPLSLSSVLSFSGDGTVHCCCVCTLHWVDLIRGLAFGTYPALPVSRYDRLCQCGCSLLTATIYPRLVGGSKKVGDLPVNDMVATTTGNQGAELQLLKPTATYVLRKCPHER